MNAKEDAIAEILDIIRRHELTLDDISVALKGRREFRTRKSATLLMRLFGYIGGIFIFSGLAAFVGMQWDAMGAPGRILSTLGVGFCIFILAIVCTTDERLQRAATPLFLIAALLQPAGILVIMDEFARGGNPAHGIIFMCFLMAVQQGCTFWVRDRTVLAFTTLLFGMGFFAVALDQLGLESDLIAAVIGLSLTCIGWGLQKSKHSALSGLCYFLGTVAFLAAAIHTLRDTAFEVLFLGLASGIIVLSTVARSRTLLVVGTLASLGYIGYFIEKYLGDSLAGPIGLIIVGFLLYGAGVVVVKINRAYIRQKQDD